MPIIPKTRPVEDTVPQINNELAVGENLEFQHKWWRFERFAWVFLTLIVVLDLLGVFGRGYFAKAEAHTTDGSIDVKYERIERTKTPSILTVKLSPTSVQNGKVSLWTSESLVTDLGNQRIIPQPRASILDKGGILYTFDAAQNPVSVQFALEPGKLGVYDLRMGVSGLERSNMKIVVMP